MTEEELMKALNGLVAQVEEMRNVVAEIQAMVAGLKPKECVYEVRLMPWHIVHRMPEAVQQQQLTSGAWCKTHGWNCPNIPRS